MAGIFSHGVDLDNIFAPSGAPLGAHGIFIGGVEITKLYKTWEQGAAAALTGIYMQTSDLSSLFQVK